MAPRPKNPPPDRRKEILDAAIQIFAQKGYSDTTNADIAQAAGVTPAALYYYFPSKEALFQAAVTERRGQIQPIVAHLLGEEMDALPPRELLTRILRGVIAFLTEPRTRALLQIILAEGQRNPAIVAMWQEQLMQVVGPVFPYLMRQMELGTVRPMDPRLFFLAFQGPLMTLVIMRDMLKLSMLTEVTDEMMVHTLVESTLTSLLTDPHKEG